jgi:serine/threonine protein kinase
MPVNVAYLNAISGYTEVGWYEVNGVDNQICTSGMSLHQANEMKDRLHPNLQAQVTPSRSEPGRYRVRVAYDELVKMSANNETFYEVDQALVMRTRLAQDKHGSAPVQFDNKIWEQVGADVNFVDRPTSYVVSLGSSDKRERLFLDTNSPAVTDLKNRIEAQCHGKTVREILEIVNKEVDNLSTRHQDVRGQSRDTIERNLDKRLEEYLEKRSKGLIPGKPANKDVPMDELMENGILVCRHKGLLAASIMGGLIDKKILPEGAARQYRSDIQDRTGKTIGAHTWSVYRDAATGELWVNDPRWAQIKKVDPRYPQDIGYGIPAVKQMIKRLDDIDKPILQAWHRQNAKPLQAEPNILQPINPNVQPVKLTPKVQPIKPMQPIKPNIQQPEYKVQPANANIVEVALETLQNWYSTKQPKVQEAYKAEYARVFIELSQLKSLHLSKDAEKMQVAEILGSNYSFDAVIRLMESNGFNFQDVREKQQQMREELLGDKGLCASAIIALDSWYMMQEMRSQAIDRANVKKLREELLTIRSLKLDPEFEKKSVLQSLDRTVDYIKFNVLQKLENHPALAYDPRVSVIQTLMEQTECKWLSEVAQPSVVVSDILSQESAKKLAERCDPALNATVRESKSRPGTFRVVIDAKVADALIKEKGVVVNPLPPEVLQPLIPQGVVPQKQPRLIISEAEWQAAEAFFKNPEKQLKGKFSKKDPSRGIYNKAFEKGSNLKAASKHSFIFINGKIYAVANGEYRVGSGTFGNVKVIQDRKGNSDVVKIENYTTKEKEILDKAGMNREREIGERVGMVKGDLVRELEGLKHFKTEYTNHKLYTVLENRGKEELFDVIHDNEDVRKPLQGLQVAIDCVEQIQALHDLRIVHCDIKPENFMATKEGERYVISAIDFGFSKYVPEGQSYIITSNGEGTPGYYAPEIANQHMYSFASDVYALGKFFNYLGANSTITDGMTAHNPNARLTLAAVKAQLISQLRTTPNLNQSAKDAIAKYDQEISQTKEMLSNFSLFPANQWEHRISTSTSFVSPPMELEEAYLLINRFPLSNNACSVEMADYPPNTFKVVVQEDKIRESQIQRQKIDQFIALKDALMGKLSDPEVKVQFNVRDEKAAKGMHLNIRAPINSIGRLFAMQNALNDMNIPCKLVQNDQEFTLILQDTAIGKISNTDQAAIALCSAEIDSDRADPFISQFTQMQSAVAELNTILDPNKVHASAFSQGKNKGMHVILNFDDFSGWVSMTQKMKDLSLHPKEEAYKLPYKLTLNIADLQKIASDPSIMARLRPLPPIPEGIPLPPIGLELPPIPSDPLPVPYEVKMRLLEVAIQSATDAAGLIKNLENYPYDIFASNGEPVDKNIMLEKMRKLSTQPDLIKAIVDNKDNPYLFAGTHITGQQGLRAKFVELVRNDHLNLKPVQKNQDINKPAPMVFQSPNRFEGKEFNEAKEIYKNELQNRGMFDLPLPLGKQPLPQKFDQDKQKKVTMIVEELFYQLVPGKKFPLISDLGDAFILHFDNKNQDPQAFNNALNLLGVPEFAHSKHGYDLTFDKKLVDKVFENIVHHKLQVGEIHSEHEFIKKSDLNGILNTSVDKLKDEYKDQHTKDANTKVGRWMVRNAKKAGGAAFGKDKDRMAQIEFLAQALNYIDKHHGNAAEKATLANYTLDLVLKQIDLKSNTFDSRLKRMCEEKQNYLKDKFPDAMTRPSDIEVIKIEGMATKVLYDKPTKKNR